MPRQDTGFALDPDALRLNAIAPYFTMFPLDFPLSVLGARARPGERVLDPFCGRGTTNFAARLLGLDSLGIDSSPVAVAITAAKLVSPSPEAIIHEARLILARTTPREIPHGEFWQWAYHPEVLEGLSRFREAFLEGSSSRSLPRMDFSPARLALRGILLGALHGPVHKTPGYLSNQLPRTYAPKPAYALRFWRSRGLKPPRVDILQVIEVRARRYYSHSLPALGRVFLGDSRKEETFRNARERFHWVVTSPPYFGMRTYVPDQWLRNWLLGGPESVEYDYSNQLTHRSPDDFVAELSRVWRNVATQSTDGARMVVRFGGICSKNVHPLDLFQRSLKGTPWKVGEVRPVPPAPRGRRQADTFGSGRDCLVKEYDIFCILNEGEN